MICACRVSEAVRIAGSLVFILLLFIFTAVLVKLRMEQDRFFSVTMATIWFINCEWAEPSQTEPDWGSCVRLSQTVSLIPPAFGAVLQGSLFGLVGLLPQKYSAIFMSGQGLAGTFAATAMLLAIGSKSTTGTSVAMQPGTFKTGWVTAMTLHSAHSHVSAGSFFMQRFRSPGVSFHDGRPSLAPPSSPPVFVDQVRPTPSPRLWVTSSRPAWGRWSRSSATCCCPAWSVSVTASLQICFWKPGLFQQSRFQRKSANVFLDSANSLVSLHTCTKSC